MTRLINPSPGELADRQTILELKIEHLDCEVSDKPPDNKPHGYVIRTIVEGIDKTGSVHRFTDELTIVRQKLEQNWVPDIAINDGKVKEYDKLYDELAEVNSNLWRLEDQARTLRAAPDKFAAAAAIRAAEVLFAITSQNDRRAELVTLINGLWGINSKEKLYI